MNDCLRPARSTRGLLLVATLVTAGCATAQPSAAVATTIDGSGDGVIDGGVYRNARLNLRADLPRGFGISQSNRGDIFRIDRRSPSVGRGFFGFWPHPPQSDMTDHFIQQIDGALRELGKSVDHPWQEVPSVFGRGWACSWTQPSRQISVRLVVLPACAGQASLVFIAWWSDAPTQAALDDWLASFKPIEGDHDASECRTLPRQ